MIVQGFGLPSAAGCHGARLAEPLQLVRAHVCVCPGACAVIRTAAAANVVLALL